ncbi:hypothetical protein KAR91_03420 [Candidatus Pacearchaeota archaeon]|nr:hypothetical protein [Candidatus Pacearchaeota archaeon]
MVGIFDGFPLNIFDDAIFDTKNPDPPVLTVREIAAVGVPPTAYSVRVVDA